MRLLYLPGAICARTTGAVPRRAARLTMILPRFLFKITWSQIELVSARINRSSAAPELALPRLCGNQLAMLRFTKMNGAGNDFVMIDNRVGDLRLAPDQ